jgi:ribonuclease J
MPVTLSFFGGQNEIGGNKILLDDGDTRLFLDFGQSFGFEGRYFDYPFLTAGEINDLELIGAIPQIKGLYCTEGKQAEYDDSGFIGLSGESERRAVSAVLISHAHLDHVGYLGLLRPDIPIYGSRITKHFIRLRREMFDTWQMKYDHESFHELEDDEQISIGSARVTHIRIDHSIPGASAYIIEMGGLKIGYTGDFRLHGRRPELTKNFIHTAKDAGIDYLLCEGTRIESVIEPVTPDQEVESHGMPSEEAVQSKLTEILSDASGLVVYDASPADMDRMEMVIETAKSFGRDVVIDTKKAYLTEGINEIAEYYPNLMDFYRCHLLLSRKKQRPVVRDGYPPRSKRKNETDEEYERYLSIFETQREYPNLFIETYEKGRLKYEKSIMSRFEDLKSDGGIPKILWGLGGRKEIIKNQNNLLLYTSYGPLTLMQIGKGLKGTYIYGKAEPFNEEMEISFSKLVAWTELLGLDIDYAHTSGHANRDHLKWTLDLIKPRFVLPIHTERADLFEHISDNVCRYKNNVRLKLTKNGPVIID